MLCNPLTHVVMAATGLKRSLLSNTSCFPNLYLFECIKKCKSKSYLNSIMTTIGKDLSLTKKKLDCLRMKLCTGVHLTVTAQDTWLKTDLSSRFSSLRNVVMSLLVMRTNHRLKERESSLYLDCQTSQMFYM